MVKWIEGGCFFFFPSSQGHLDKIEDLFIAFFPVRLLKNLSPREESMFHEIEARISSMVYDVECYMEMESPRYIGVLCVLLLGLVPCCLPGCCVWVSEKTEPEKHSWSKESLLAGVDCPVRWLYYQGWALRGERAKHQFSLDMLNVTTLSLRE